jgi:hypothetical protein
LLHFAARLSLFGGFNTYSDLLLQKQTLASSPSLKTFMTVLKEEKVL